MGTPERIPDDERKRGEGRKRRNKDGGRKQRRKLISQRK